MKVFAAALSTPTRRSPPSAVPVGRRMRSPSRASAAQRSSWTGNHGLPAARQRGPWRAVWIEDGRRRYCEAVTEAKLSSARSMQGL